MPVKLPKSLDGYVVSASPSKDGETITLVVDREDGREPGGKPVAVMTYKLGRAHSLSMMLGRVVADAHERRKAVRAAAKSEPRPGGGTTP